MDVAASRMPLVVDAELLERFWSKVKRYDVDDVCWPWMGAAQGTGYGAFKIGNVKIDAHVLAWRLSNGGVAVPEFLEVLHSCDVRACARPEHLSVGTRLKNVLDAYGRKRMTTPWAQGSRHPHAKLNEDIVRFIRKRRQDGVSGRGIADEVKSAYGIVVSVKVVWKIVYRTAWKHVA